MNFEDTARVIASYLDNNTLEKLFFSGAMPSLLNLSLDQNFWHARVETLAGRRFSFSPSADWRDTYRILNEELSRVSPSRLRIFYNKNDNVLACEILLSLGYLPDEGSLTLAAEYGRAKILQFLLEEGSINPAGTVLCISPLVRATQERHIECVRLLLADPRVNPGTDISYESALGQACMSDNCEEIVKLLLSDPRVDPGDSIYLRLASEFGDNTEIVKLLLADPRVNPDEDTIIHASGLGREKIVALLLARMNE